jgi:hypothetical protein
MRSAVQGPSMCTCLSKCPSWSCNPVAKLAYKCTYCVYMWHTMLAPPAHAQDLEQAHPGKQELEDTDAICHADE